MAERLDKKMSKEEMIEKVMQYTKKQIEQRLNADGENFNIVISKFYKTFDVMVNWDGFDCEEDVIFEYGNDYGEWERV